MGKEEKNGVYPKEGKKVTTAPFSKSKGEKLKKSGWGCEGKHIRLFLQRSVGCRLHQEGGWVENKGWELI